MSAQVSTDDLVAMLEDARARTLELVSGLDQGASDGPAERDREPPSLGNRPSRWFHEHFILRGLDGRRPEWRKPRALRLARVVPHATRWSIPLRLCPTPWPTWPCVMGRLSVVSKAASRHRRRPSSTSSSPSTRICTTRPSTYTRQTLGYPRRPSPPQPRPGTRGRVPGKGDVRGRRGQVAARAEPDGGFVFDNE